MCAVEFLLSQLAVILHVQEESQLDHETKTLMDKIRVKKFQGCSDGFSNIKD